MSNFANHSPTSGPYNFYSTSVRQQSQNPWQLEDHSQDAGFVTLAAVLLGGGLLVLGLLISVGETPQQPLHQLPPPTHTALLCRLLSAKYRTNLIEGICLTTSSLCLVPQPRASSISQSSSRSTQGRPRKSSRWQLRLLSASTCFSS